MSAVELLAASPTIPVSLDRRLVERLLPGAIAEAETVGAGLPDERERAAWIAGRIGARLLERLTEVDRAARRMVQLLDAGDQTSIDPAAPKPLVSAGELASVLGVSRSTVYEHALELGARRLGGGDRPRLRFDVDQALEAWTRRVSGERSQAAETPGTAGTRTRRRRNAARSEGGLLAVKGRAEA